MPSLLLLFTEPVKAFCEEAPGPPELVELVVSLRVEGVDLAGWALLGRHLLHVDEAALLDAHEQRVDRALGDVGEALVAQPGGDLVAVRGPPGEDREHDPLQRPLEHLAHLLAHETSSHYSVSLTTGT